MTLTETLKKHEGETLTRRLIHKIVVEYIDQEYKNKPRN